MVSSVWDRLKDFDGYDGVVLDREEADRLLHEYQRLRLAVREAVRLLARGHLYSAECRLAEALHQLPEA